MKLITLKNSTIFQRICALVSISICILFLLTNSLRSVVGGGNVLSNGDLQLSVVCSIDLILLLSLVEDDETRLGSERSVAKAGEDLFWDELLCGAEELHAGKVLIELHEQVPIVLLHGVAAAAPSQVQVNAYITRYKATTVKHLSALDSCNTYRSFFCFQH